MQTADDAPRQLGFWMCTALVVGNTIGMGIFMLPASLAPYGFNAFIGWGICVGGCLALALVFAQLARLMPEADGPFGYVRAGFGEAPAFLMMWCYWLSVWVTNAALAVAVVGYAPSALPALAQVPQAVSTIGLIWLFVAINLFGLRSGGGAQLLTTVLKLLPLGLVIGLGFALLINEPSAYTQQRPETPLSLAASMGAATIALYALLGIESAAVPAGRVRDPARTVPRATLVGTGLIALIYLAVSAVILLLLPQAELGASNAPFVDLLDRLQGEGSGRWIAPFVVISGLGALNGWTLLAGELTRSLAARRLLPAWLDRSNRFGAPSHALITIGALASVVAAMNYSRSLVEGFTLLSVIVTAASLPMYFLCSLTLLWLGRRVGLPPLALISGGVGVGFAVFAFFGAGAEPTAWAVALAALGLPVYWLRRRA